MKHTFAAHYFRTNHFAAGLWRGEGLQLLVPGAEYAIRCPRRLHYRATEEDGEEEEE